MADAGDGVMEYQLNSSEANSSFLLGNETTNENGTGELKYISSTLIKSPEALAVPIVFGIIFIVGVIGNGTTIITVLKNKTMRNVPNIYIVSLACGDLLLILISVPCMATLYTFLGWPYGLVMCKVTHFLRTMSLGVSVFTLTALGGDRYTAIVNPMSKHMGNPIARTIVTSVSIWVASIALAIVDGISARVSYHQHRDTQEVFYTCIEYPGNWGEWYPKFHTIFRFIIYFALPVYIIALFYVMIARILVHSSYHMPVEGGAKSSQGNKQAEARKKVAIVVLLLVVIFVICWLPRHIFSMWWHFDPNDYNEFWHIFKVTGFCLSFINSCVNPITLYFLSKQFRKYFNRYLFCLCSRKKRLRADVGSTSMYNFNSTVRRTSTTMTMLPNSQSL